MYTRYAYFLGRPVVGSEAQFAAGLEAAVLLYARLPRMRSAQLEFAIHVDEGAPPVFAIIRLNFDSAQDIEDALASPERQRARAAFVSDVMPLFEGKVVHINFHGIAFPGAGEPA